MLQISEILKFVLQRNGLGNDSSANPSLDRSGGRYEKNPPPVVVWNITNNCNMSCPHCYSSAHKNNPSSNMTVSDARIILDRLSDYGVKIIILSGGEPLMHPDFFRILEYAKGKGFICHLSSNGVLLDRGIARDLKNGGIEYVGVSLDGTPEANDSHRGFKGGFQRALSGLVECGNLGLHTGLRFTLSGKNSDQLFYLLNLALDNNICRFYISHLLYSGRAERYSRFDLEHERSREIVERIFSFSLEQVRAGSKIKVVTGGNDADGVFLYDYARKNLGDAAAEAVLDILKRRGGNSAGEKIINIDHTGSVHPDQFFRAVNCGNILKKELREIMETEIIQKLRQREIYLKGRCGECNYRCICRGSHRERALFAHGDMWEEDPACYLTDSFIRGGEEPCAVAV